jgi:hypothetical protein
METSPFELMFQTITGMWASQAVGTLAELGVADRLIEGPRRADELAPAMGCDAGALNRLLRACASLGVLEERDGAGFALTPLGETLRSNTLGSMRDLAVAMTAPGHWLPWGRLREAVRTGQRQARAALGREVFEHYAANPREAASFTGAMDNLSALVAGEVARLVDTTRFRRAVDVGGANGTLIAALLQSNAGLRGVVVDLPHVAEGARAAVAAAGVGGRCEVVAGDFFQGVPSGDLYLLKQILHDWDDGQCQVILGHCARGMSPHGRLVAVEMVIPDDHRPSPAYLLDLDMLVLVPGRERTRREYAALLAGAGLRLDRIVDTITPFQIIEASRAP